MSQSVVLSHRSVAVGRLVALISPRFMPLYVKAFRKYHTYQPIFKNQRMEKIVNVQEHIESVFRQQVLNDKKVKNACLLVHSEKLGIDINIAEGKTGEIQANPKQANHLASVGKLFTATVIGMLQEKGLLNFDDKIAQYLDKDLMRGLHMSIRTKTVAVISASNIY
jgi:hypothetical protein